MTEAAQPSLPAPPRIRVAVDTPQHSGLSGPLDYLSPQALPPGSLVRVPLGRREMLGIVWPGEPSGDTDPALLRPILSSLDGLPPLSPAWCQLVEFAANYYQRSVGEVALSVLPPQLRELDGPKLKLRMKRAAKLGAQNSGSGETPAPGLPTLSPAQAEVLAQLDALLAAPRERTAPPPVLLYGVTGSGKTEVYLRAAEHALKQGRQVLVLVPEINLTPQLEARFAERFAGRRLVSLHSGLTPAQRLRHWLSAHLGEADLVLGTRLAVFASMPRLGLIVVDEEHDPSYKQQDGARYSARDLAVYRAHLEKLPVILGSATPSLESWQRANEGRYKRLALPGRIGGGTLPQVRLFDMKLLPLSKGVTTALTAPLIQALRTRLERKEQSLIFLNRRGYAPVLHCGECNWKSDCPHCSAWRVFHKGDRTLRCHHCGFTERVPSACPTCGNQDIAPLGRGTERLEEQLAETFPEARVARIDADSTKHKGELEAQLQAVHAGEVDILVGTQMITKGHDFRGITLVAAINPDGALFSSDFRAPERLFALLMQAGGRAGRDASQAARSEMWVQTWHPEHALYKALAKHDFEAFAQSQLAERESAGLPPYAHLALLRAEGRTVAAAQGFLDAASAYAQQLPEAMGVLIYPAIPMSVARVANVERMQMLIEAGSRGALQRLLWHWMPELHALKREHKGLLRWAVDVDPLAI
ncbi:primosomal protein N' (replication factor Y) [Paucibacter oligotrophus]|uniref:Replication restart protein PriA n=1 Tax=Roseateles oligotrophus TaxID=1769250 RepID=A0A840L8V3_9BURK|nr:primosomal protein N' [Roseateles oligotrophus]MBB4843102.1 primosomal protein N' (replication factor Y) [Roseateles oligotrophus]